MDEQTRTQIENQAYELIIHTTLTTEQIYTTIENIRKRFDQIPTYKITKTK